MPATDELVPNSEHAIDAATKAAAIAAAKAEAERVAAERVAGEEILTSLTPKVIEAAAEFTRTDEERNAAQLTLGYRLFDVESALIAAPALEQTIQGYCEEHLPELSGPMLFTSSPAYRALQAARVAAVIKADIGATTVDGLRKLHRVKDVPGAATKVYKAAKAKTKRGSRVSGRVLEETLDELFPKDETKTPGPSKGSAKTETKTEERNTPVADDKVTELPDRVVSEATLGGAATLIGKCFDELAEDGRPMAHVIAAAVIKSCEKYGIAATKVAIEAVKPKPQPRKRAAKTN